MAKIFAQDVIEIAMQQTYGGRPVVNVLHVRNDEAGGNDETKVRDVLDNWQDHILDLVSSGLTLQGAVWRSLDPSEGTVGFMAPDNTKPVVGSQTSSTLPPNVALLIKKQTSGRERGQRDGRMFLAGISEQEVDNSGALTSAALSAWQASVDLFLSGINDSGFAGNTGSGLVVLNTTPESRLPGTNEVTLTYRAVTGLVIDPKVSTQRDRLR